MRTLDPNEIEKAAEEGRIAFQRIGPALSDHYIYGKSRPRTPPCPYRIQAKVRAWHRGYAEQLDELMRELADDEGKE